MCFGLNAGAKTYLHHYNNPIFISDGFPEEGKISAPVPNPVNDYAEIFYNLPQNQNGEIAIYDFTGTKIKSTAIKGGQGQVKISAYELKEGVYFVCLISEGKNLDAKKLIKK